MRFKSLALLAVLSSLGATVFANSQKSPAAFLEFKDGAGDTVKDSSGNNNTGKIMSAEACQWAREDDRGFFLVIDNRSNSDKAHVRIEDSPGLNLSGPVTVIIYFACDTSVCEKRFPFANLLTKGADYNGGVSIMLASSGDTLVNMKGLTPEYQTYKTGIKSGAENVLAVIYNGLDVKVYVNGKLSGTTKVTGKPAVNKSPVYIGNFPHLRYKFKGNLYAVKIYNEALSENELKDAFKINLKGLSEPVLLAAEKKWPTPGETADKPGTVYFNDFDKLEPRALISESQEPGLWWLRRNVNFMAHGPNVLHTPAGYFPEPDLSFSPGLTGKYDIFAGMRIVNYKTMLQIKTDSMKDYATIEPPVSEKHENIEILALENVDVTGQKIKIHPCGDNAYFGYVKFVPAGGMADSEKTQYLKAKTEPARDRERYQRDLMADSDFRERIYVEEKKMPELTAAQKSLGYIVFPVNWQKLVFPVTVPEKNYEGVSLKLSAAQGEFEPVSFCVRALENISGLSAALSGPLKGADGKSLNCGVDIGVVDCLPKHTTNFGGKNAEFMNGPQYIEPAKPLAVKKDETRQFWLTFEIPENAAPGKYSGKMTLKCENKPGLQLPVELEVYPFRPAPLRGFNTGLVTAFKNIGGATIEDELADMRKHGMTSVFAFAHDLKIKGENAESIKIDFEKSRIARAAEAMLKQGFKGDLILSTTDIRLCADSIERRGGSFETAYLNIIKQLEERAKKSGWPKLVYQSFDELPSYPMNFPAFTREMTLLKKAGATTEHDHMWYKTSRPLQAEIDKCVNLVDIFLLRYNNRNLFYVDAWEDIVKKCLELNKGIYPYNSDNACAFAEPSSMRFIGGWFFRTLGNGCGGNFLYIYQYFSGSPYNDFDGDQCTDWMYRYPPEGERKGGPSLKWEALREGVDDLKYIVTLENLIKECATKGKTQAVADAGKLLDGIKSSFDLNTMKSKCVFLESKWDKEWKDSSGKLFASGNFNLPNGWSFEKYDEVREQIARKIIELKKELAGHDGNNI